jgi:hypothetical protein
VAALASDWEAARDVRLELPETGVCSSDAGLEADDSACCGTPAADASRGLATGVVGGLITLPLAPVASSGGGCRG